MAEYKYEFDFYDSKNENDYERLKECKYLLDEEKEIDKEIKTLFPIGAFGDENDTFCIRGSKEFFKHYKNMDDKKYDRICSYSDVKYHGFTTDGDIIFDFIDDSNPITAYSIYDFKQQFLHQFSANKFIDNCRKKDCEDLIKINMEYLLDKYKDTKRQFRFLCSESEELLLRGFTTMAYKNYDNSVAVYLAFLALHKYAKDNNRKYAINRAIYTDSYMNIFFENVNGTFIDGVGNVFIGISVRNGEIRNKTFSAHMRYRIVDEEGNHKFSGIFHDDVFSIGHKLGVDKVGERLEGFSNLDKHEDKILEFIRNVKEVETLTEEKASFVFRKLLENVKKESGISSSTKTEFSKRKLEDIIDSSYSLMASLNKIQTIKTDIDERFFIERICHKVAEELVERK